MINISSDSDIKIWSRVLNWLWCTKIVNSMDMMVAVYYIYMKEQQQFVPGIKYILKNINVNEFFKLGDYLSKSLDSLENRLQVYKWIPSYGTFGETRFNELLGKTEAEYIKNTLTGLIAMHKKAVLDIDVYIKNDLRKYGALAGCYITAWNIMLKYDFTLWVNIRLMPDYINVLNRKIDIKDMIKHKMVSDFDGKILLTDDLFGSNDFKNKSFKENYTRNDNFNKNKYEKRYNNNNKSKNIRVNNYSNNNVQDLVKKLDENKLNIDIDVLKNIYDVKGSIADKFNKVCDILNADKNNIIDGQKCCFYYTLFNRCYNANRCRYAHGCSYCKKVAHPLVYCMKLGKKVQKKFK